MTDDKNHISARLERVAGEIAEPHSMPPGVRRRIQRKIAAITAGTLLVLTGAVAGVASFDGIGRDRPEPRPAAPGEDVVDVVAGMRGRIAFLSNRAAGRGQGIFVLAVRPDENRVYPIRVRDFEGSQIAWAPGGGRILFNRGIDHGASQLVVVSLSDGSETVIIGDSPDEAKLQPVSATWSPNGDFIVFSTGDGSIYRVNATGENLVRLTSPQPQCFDSAPAWSPDSTEIAFSRDCGNTRIFTMTSDGDSQEAVTEGPWDTDPAWSPDGAEIAFSRRTDSEQIFVVARAGGPERQVTETGNNFTPTWSPDGSAIAFASNRDGDINIYATDRAGAAEDQLTFTRADEMSPEWASD